ncbi:hypothetical protein D349_00034 [Enterococcus faecalis UP2S-6]|nr:hypothetical protein D349_00034 [Enterococcus faecalis UP2S-6]
MVAKKLPYFFKNKKEPLKRALCSAPPKFRFFGLTLGAYLNWQNTIMHSRKT